MARGLSRISLCLLSGLAAVLSSGGLAAEASPCQPPGFEETSFPPSLDLRLRDGSKAIDAATVIPNLAHSFAGRALA